MKIKKIFNWQVVLGIILILLSAAVYYIHYLIFRDARHIFIYLIGDIAFVFLEVFLVTLVVHNLLAHREKAVLFKKMNMVIGAFFSEVGRDLIKFCITFDPQSCDFSKKLVVRTEWTEGQFRSLQKEVLGFACNIDYQRGNLEELKCFLAGKRAFLLALLENQNLLEHETFTDLLWAVFHLTEELEGRDDLKKLPATDYEHIANDIKRVYRKLINQWLLYMKHLKADYPYLFSLAMRTNPFDDQANIQVR
ncbi:MAG TPA: hypothetical protein PL125_00605 [Candidatus Omnitrophota bacterium]|nr:hypothetical protein [Candidatus Omnitrophota bacterium]HPT38690.1 hypothetical protein [Candidatus Omnitrophota bacterium]